MEEIKQDWRKKLEHVVKYRLTTDFVTDRQILTELFDSLLSQALQKRDSELLERIKFDMKGRNSLIVEIEDIEQILKDINSNN